MPYATASAPIPGERPSIDKERPDVRVHAYLTEREATLYLDTSGEALFKRGWRREADVAPLRENLAAGVLALAGWAPGTPLLDPMCGAGTIAIEAALDAAGHRAGHAAHVRLPEARVVRRSDVAADPAARARPGASGPVRAFDLRERHRSARGGAVPPQRRRRGRRGVARHRRGRRARAGRPGAFRPAGRQSALRRQARRRSTRWRRSIRSWATR